MIRALSCVIIVSFSAFSCTKPQPIPKNLVLAHVGDKTITIQDFIRRAEYSIRPAYCRQSNYVHKKIVLNSLIAEKLAALEMKKNEDELLASSHFKSFLKGRKEQAMRQVFYHDEFYDAVTIPDTEVQDHFAMAGRIIQVNYLNLPDIKTIQKILELSQDNVSLDSIFKSLWEGDVPTREIRWFDREPEVIHAQLFQKELKKGQLVGPFKTEDNTYLIMEVDGWIDRPALTGEDQKLRWNDVRERLTEKTARSHYMEYVENLMAGNKMELNPDVFDTYATLAADYYIKDDDEKKDALNQAIWNQIEQPDVKNFKVNPELDLTATLFTYNGETWTIQAFNDLLKSRPLVFRKRKMNKGEFPSQLRLAVADVLMDFEITQECYEAGIDRNWTIASNVDLWHDAYASKRYIDVKKPDRDGVESEKELLDFFNPVIDSLQGVYSYKIVINMDAFEDIELTATDMVVTQKGVPYPIMVPLFPIITTDNRLDYGSKSD